MSLSREAHKAQRELSKPQAARTTEPVPRHAPPTHAERDPLQAARDILNGNIPFEHPSADQLRKQAMARIIRDNAALHASTQALQVLRAA